MRKFACFDIGGTAIKYGVLTEDAKILTSLTMPTEAYKGPEVWMMNIVQAIKDMQKDHDIQGICISSSAMIDSNRGVVVYSLPQIPNYTGFDIKDFLEVNCKLPCTVENDVNCMVLAESISGAGKGCETVLGLAVGTGVGGGFTVNGKLLHGSSFSACEVGYLRIGDSDLEHLASTTALCRKVEALKKDKRGSWDGRKVFDAAMKGDLDCQDAIDDMADKLAQGLGMLSYILNPDVIVLGGGIMGQPSLLGKVRVRYPLYVKQVIAENTEIKAAHYGNEAGMIGALYHFLTLQKEGCSL